jgi:hypothetical protein
VPHPLHKLECVNGSAAVHLVEAELNCLERFLPTRYLVTPSFPRERFGPLPASIASFALKAILNSPSRLHRDLDLSIRSSASCSN